MDRIHPSRQLSFGVATLARAWDVATLARAWGVATLARAWDVATLARAWKSQQLGVATLARAWKSQQLGVATLARAWTPQRNHRLATVATKRSARRRSTAGFGLPAACLLALALSSGTAVAQEVVLQPLQLDAIPQGAASEFLPPLQTALTAELHFVKKVCHPEENQFNKVHRAGRKSILALATDYSELKRKRVKVDDWPAPSEAVIEAVEVAVHQNLPADVAEAYHREIVARRDAHREANASAVVLLIDQSVMLDPDQEQELFQALRDGWQPHWSDAFVTLMYEKYAILPEIDVLAPYLTDLQQRLWKSRPRRRYASLLWQLRFGVYEMFEVEGLADFADPDAQVDAAEVE